MISIFFILSTKSLATIRSLYILDYAIDQDTGNFGSRKFSINTYK
jgi:hypothetical protein